MKATIAIPALLTVLLAVDTTPGYAADTPSPRAVEAPFCAEAGARTCMNANGQPVRFWWGHAYKIGAEERYAGFVTLLPRQGEAPNPYASLPLMVVEFRWEGNAWRPGQPVDPIGQLRMTGTGLPPAPEPRSGVPSRDLPDGGAVLAIPTAMPPSDGRQVHTYDILRRGPAGWAYGGFVPGAVDESKACRAEAKQNGDDPRECEDVQGNLLFEAVKQPEWPELVVSLDLVGRRNGQPFTTTAWEQHRYAYDAAARRYVERTP